MQLPENARLILLNAEERLAALAHEASQTRDYDGATTLLEAARRVKLLADDGVESAQDSAPSIGAAGASGNDGTPAIAPARRPRKQDYPKFIRDGESLVKIGWSKAEKAEYEHKSPRKVLDVLGAALSRVGAKGRRFTMEKVLPLTDPSDVAALPDYQCYLCLAWLRHSGLITQHGRQGYSLPKNSDLCTAIERTWAKLPNRS